MSDEYDYIDPAPQGQPWWGWLGLFGILCGGAVYGYFRGRKTYGKWRVGMLHRSSKKHHQIHTEKLSKALRMAERYGVSTKDLKEIANNSTSNKDALKKLNAEIADVKEGMEANKLAFRECCKAANEFTGRSRVPTTQGGRVPNEWKNAYNLCRSEIVGKKSGISIPDANDDGFGALAKAMGL